MHLLGVVLYPCRMLNLLYQTETIKNLNLVFQSQYMLWKLDTTWPEFWRASKNYVTSIQNNITKQIMNEQRPQTLREYLDSYHELRKCKSAQNLHGVLSAVSNFKSTLELENQINQNLNSIKISLTSNNLKAKQRSLMEKVHVLTKLIKQILAKLKSLEGIQEEKKNKNLISSHMSSRFKKTQSNSRKSSFREEQLKKIKSAEQLLPKIKSQQCLICPQKMSKKIKLENLSIQLNSHTTEPRSQSECKSPILQVKQNDLSALQYFNNKIKKIVSINPERYQKQVSTGSYLLEDEEYTIKISSFNQITGLRAP